VAEPADATPPKWFQRRESPLKVTDLWAEVQKLPMVATVVTLVTAQPQLPGASEYNNI
jgi:hypothetical protein